jgi:D-amino peptidase
VKVFISADLEGASGVFSHSQLARGSAGVAAARASLRDDVAAAIDGCLAAGADEIVVCDGHGLGDDLAAGAFPPQASLVAGADGPLWMMGGIDGSFDAALLVGYHAMAGTRAALLDHTFAAEVFRIRVDDLIEVGEVGLNAAIAGAFGVPVVFVSGDDKLAAEAEALLPGVRTAVVKDALSRDAARLLAPGVARSRLRDGVEEALRAAERPAALVWDEMPLRVVFTRCDHCDAAAACPGVQRVDGRTIRIEGPDYLSVFGTLVACLEAVRTHRPETVSA